MLETFDPARVTGGILGGQIDRGARLAASYPAVEACPGVRVLATYGISLAGLRQRVNVKLIAS